MSALFPHPLLVCDIGGTNVRIGLVRTLGGPIERLDPQLTAHFPSFELMLAHVLQACSLSPRSLLMSAAGPLHNRKISLTNAPWILDGPSIAKTFGLAQGLLLNDFESLAFSLPSLGPDQTRTFGDDPPSREGPQLILGPGTGLGLSLLIQTRDGYSALPSEAGHIGLGPMSEEDFSIWPFIERPLGRVSAETLLSGPGLTRLHQARLKSLGHMNTEALSAQQISHEARLNPDSEAAKSLRYFWRLIAQFTGDMAICFAASGGVTLAGGVLPKIQSFIDPHSFRRIFMAKPPMQSFLEKLPIRMIVDDSAALSGLVSIATTPDQFTIDYSKRLCVDASP